MPSSILILVIFISLLFHRSSIRLQKLFFPSQLWFSSPEIDLETANSALQQRPKHVSSHCVNSSTAQCQGPIFHKCLCSASVEAWSQRMCCPLLQSSEPKTKTKPKGNSRKRNRPPVLGLTSLLASWMFPMWNKKRKQTRNKKFCWGFLFTAKHIIITPDNGHETSLVQTLVPSNT